MYENVDFYAKLYNIPAAERHTRIQDLLKFFDLWHIKDRKASALSAGETTRAILAKAFIPNPDIVLLDEPTASLDPDIAHAVRKFVLEQRKERNVSILFTSHNMDEVTAVCDRVLVMKQGVIIADDTPQKLAARIANAHVRLVASVNLERIKQFITDGGYPWQSDGNDIAIEVPEHKIAQLLIGLTKNNLQYDHVSIDQPTLEDYFLSVAKRDRGCSMNWYRIFALVQRNIMISYRGIDPLIDIFYWPLYDIVLWGFTATWFAFSSGQPISLIWLTGLVLWQACLRASFDVSINLLTELWSRNVVNLFATPLEIKEWIVGAMVLGFLDALICIVYGSIVVALLYGVNIFAVGSIFVPALLLLILAGWAIGFFVAGFLIKAGQKVQKLAWVLGWFFVPFSALFYPLNSLPRWAVIVAKLFPMSYIYEGLRMYIAQGIYPWFHLGMGFLLSSCYFGLAILFFIKMFHKSRSAGLARLEQE